MNRLLERNIANRSADYRRTQPCPTDREGRQLSTVAYASRSFTEWRSPSGVVDVRREPKRRMEFEKSR